MMRVQPQYLSFGKLSTGRLFRIPEYQRAYSWKTKQRQDLFEDIKKVYGQGAGSGHFMATLVCLRRETQELGTDEYQRLDVVDGQQRLTTLTILMKAIALASAQDDSGAKIAAEINALLVKADSDDLFLLQTNHDSSHYYSKFMRLGTAPTSETATTIADKEMLLAIKECTLFVQQWASSNGLSTLVALLKNRLFFLLHEIDDEKSVYSVFEVLNSRGLDVSWLDRLKTIMMGKAFDLPIKSASKNQLIDELRAVWREIYACIGLRQGMSTEALRFSATLRTSSMPSRPLGEEDAVDIFRESCVDAKSVRESAHWLLQVTKACDQVLADKHLNAVTNIAQARLLATAVQLAPRFSANERSAIIDHWERISFRIYGLLRNDARTGVGNYTRLAWRVVNSNAMAKEICSEIKKIGGDYPIKDAVKAVENENCYEGWESELRYLLFCYEQHLAKVVANQSYTSKEWDKIWLANPFESIEHIWPQSTSPSSHCHRLGNLVLLPPSLNSKLRAKEPRKKADSYRKTGMLIVQEVASLIDETGWTKKDIEAREANMLEWIRSRWADPKSL